jgi:hypothetical protein
MREQLDAAERQRMTGNHFVHSAISVSVSARLDSFYLIVC